MGGGREGERRQRRGAGVSLCVVVEVVVVVWRWWWRWCTHTNIPLLAGWLAHCCPKDPELQPARAGLAASLRTPSRRQQRQSRAMA